MRGGVTGLQEVTKKTADVVVVVLIVESELTITLDVEGFQRPGQAHVGRSFPSSSERLSM